MLVFEEREEHVAECVRLIDDALDARLKAIERDDGRHCDADAYRGRDELWWMDASGIWDQRHDQVPEQDRWPDYPSPNGHVLLAFGL